jgi:7,8-dihydro-6-hydroxymethylpterin-pyrophosphokinase
MDFPDLIIPHPRMHQRRFVLQPMCDLAPDMRHPVSGKTMRDLLGRLDDADQKVMPI